jgi:hypothetical protein
MCFISASSFAKHLTAAASAATSGLRILTAQWRLLTDEWLSSASCAGARGDAVAALGMRACAAAGVAAAAAETRSSSM